MKQSSLAWDVDARVALEIKSKPKAMLTVGNGPRPFLDYLLFNAEKSGHTQVAIVVGEGDNSIRQYYEEDGGAKQFRNLAICYLVQEIPIGRVKPLGTADALLQALRALRHWRGKRFTVCNADNLYSVAALTLLLNDQHDNAMIDYDRAALEFSEERIAQFAVTVKSKNGYLSDIIEKPSSGEVGGAQDEHGRIGVSMNIWRFKYEHILPFLESLPVHPVRQEKELPVAVKAMIAAHPLSVFAIPLAEHVIDLTTQSDIAIVQDYLRREFPLMSR